VPRAKTNSNTPELRVIKKLAPGDRGAKTLASRYGNALLCVRHRQDASGTKRVTTVELIVGETTIARRPGPTVDVALHPSERALRAKLKAVGARWHESEGVWTLRRSTVIALGLKERIVPREP
jgi:hypothetical protein